MQPSWLAANSASRLKGVRQGEPSLAIRGGSGGIDLADGQPRIAQQLDQRDPIAEAPVLPVRADGRQIPMRAVTSIVRLAELAQQIQRIAQQLLKVIQQSRQGARQCSASARSGSDECTWSAASTSSQSTSCFRRSGASASSSFSSQRNGFFSATLAPSSSRNSRRSVAVRPSRLSRVLPAVEIQIAPRRFHPTGQQQAPQRLHQRPRDGVGGIGANFVQFGRSCLPAPGGQICQLVLDQPRPAVVQLAAHAEPAKGSTPGRSDAAPASAPAGTSRRPIGCPLRPRRPATSTARGYRARGGGSG